MLYNNSLENEQTPNQETITEQVEAIPTSPATQSGTMPTGQLDSASLAQTQRQLGSFGYSATLPSATNQTTSVSNGLLELKIANKGGYISEARLTKYKTFDSIPVYLIKDENASFNLTFTTSDGRTLNTKELFLNPR